MLTSLGLVLLALIMLAAGETLPNETKETYKDKGYNWSKVLLYSNLAGVIGGVISAASVSSLPAYLNPHLIPFAVTVLSYLTMQSIMTDIRTFLINRNILRVSYVSLYAFSIYNVFSSNLFSENRFALLVFSITLVFIFIVVPIGASDVRMMAAAIPFVISIGGSSAIGIFILVLLGLSIFMITQRTLILIPRIKEMKKNNNDMYKEMGPIVFYTNAMRVTTNDFNRKEEGKKAVGPFMTLSFLVYLLAYPVFI